MSKKFGKFLLFTAAAGAAAYGAYHYLQTKDKAPSSPSDEDMDDDFDDFGEDLDEDADPDKERSYVPLNLDKAEALASEAFHKAKEVISDSVQQVKDTVKSVTESQAGPESNFTDLTALNKEKNAHSEEAVSDEPSEPVSSEESESPASSDEEGSGTPAKNTVEEFYDDNV